MVSRRRFLAALTVPLAGLAGCPDLGGTETEAPSPPPTSSTRASPVSTRRPGETPGPQEGTGTSRGSPEEREPTATEDPFADRFATIYDVTAQGADPSGSSAIDDTLHSLVDDNTLVRFPPGTYRVNNLTVTDVTNFGMIGTDATLKLDQPGRTIYLAVRRVSDVLIDGFTIDNSASNTAAWCDIRCVGGKNVVRNYTVDGFVDVSQRTNGFTLMVEGKNSSLTIENADLGQGAINGAATYVFPRREFSDPNREAGSLTFRNCVMRGWGKEGLYASAHEGPLRVIGGEYANNAIDQVRIGAGNAPERAIVRDVSVIVDSVPDYMPQRNRIMRGIWLKEGDKALIENCDITLADLGRDATPGAIYVNNQFGRATIRDCSITTQNVSRPAILIQRPTGAYDDGWMPSLDHLPTEWGVTAENVTINGESPNTEAIRVGGRDGCTFRDVSIEKEGQGSDGLLLRSVSDCTLEGGSLTTERFPVLIEFNGDDDCVLTITDSVLSGTQLERDGTQLLGDNQGEYCIGNDVLQDSKNSETDKLALTQTAESTGTDVPQGRGGNRFQLYGRWVA